MEQVISQRPIKPTLTYLAWAFVFLNTIDILSTLVIMRNGVELNPIIALLLKQPFYVAIMVKVLGSAAGVCVLLALSKKYEQTVFRTLFGLVLGMGFICTFNLVGLMMAR